MRARTLVALLAISVALSTAAGNARGQSAPEALSLGKLAAGESVEFSKQADGTWGVFVAGGPAPRVDLATPAAIDRNAPGADVRRLSSGYARCERAGDAIDAVARFELGTKSVLTVSDHWSVEGPVVTVKRAIAVAGDGEGGFGSAFDLGFDPAVAWKDVQFLIPGLLYGDATYDGTYTPGGTANDAAKRFVIREDLLSAPLIGASFANGASITLLDSEPRGNTTLAETKLATPTVTDARLQFGALSARQDGQHVSLGFTFPGSSPARGGATQPAEPQMLRRFHPIRDGVTHQYELKIRFGKDESFAAMTRASWRWAWDTLKPPVHAIDVEAVRRVLIDHLQSQVNFIDGRAAIPFVISTIVDDRQWNYTMATMGFVGKDLECADQLLREGDRDPSPRGQKMRATGLQMIETLIKALPTVPLQGAGFDLATGKPWDNTTQQSDQNWTAPWLRNATEDLRVLMRAYIRERDAGRQHPEWLAWAKQYADWLLKQQRDDGSWPRRWERGSDAVAEPTGTSSYCPVPFLVLMAQVTKDERYQESALRAANYVWNEFGQRGLFVGGAIDNPNITDKEAGMLSMEAFLSLYDATKDAAWLERAQVAGTFAESWIWIWTVPMPDDADDSQLHWKKEVPAIGFQGITAAAAGGVDQYLDWAVPSYAKLYLLTKDPHYLAVARVLLHDTKAMVAMPGRQFDVKGIGWQQEGWNMSAGRNGRGVSGHRFWLPWVSANHLYGITGLEELDADLYKRLCSPTAE